MGAGPTGTLVPADNNSADVKHLDVGDMSDVSDVRVNRSKTLPNILTFRFFLSISFDYTFLSTG